ncbi:MAG: hypothetical protein Q7T74_07480 [Candidatus Saccharibacteria bacterium]|nr:hypothetical protein [Candidatus Saccharibacteria bacterium]
MEPNSPENSQQNNPEAPVQPLEPTPQQIQTTPLPPPNKGSKKTIKIIIIIAVIFFVIIPIIVMIMSANSFVKKELKKDKKTSTSQKNQDLVTKKLTMNKVQVTYNKEYWKVKESKSEVEEGACGTNNVDFLDLVHSDMKVYINLGHEPCMKGGTTCFDEANYDKEKCYVEDKQVGEVSLGTTKHILAEKYVDTTMADTGGASYSVSITDEYTPGKQYPICLVSCLKLPNSSSATINAYYSFESETAASQKSGNLSLDEFINKPEVQEAIKVLKTARAY